MAHKVKKGFPGLHNFIAELQKPEVKAEVMREQINSVAASFSPAEITVFLSNNKPAARYHYKFAA